MSHVRHRGLPKADVSSSLIADIESEHGESTYVRKVNCFKLSPLDNFFDNSSLVGYTWFVESIEKV